MNKVIKHPKLGECELLMSYENSDGTCFMWLVKSLTYIVRETKLSDRLFKYKLCNCGRFRFYTLINTENDILDTGVIPHVTKNLEPRTEESSIKAFIKSTKLGNSLKFTKIK